MYFLLQYNDEDYKDVEQYLIKNLIGEKSRIHDCICTTYKELEDVLKNDNLPLKDMIPVGSLKFVEKFLLDVHGVKSMNCIEVPKILRKDKYLKRRYAVLDKDDLPDSGYYFLKYASKLKDYTYRGLIEFLPKEDLGNGEPYLKEGKYVISEIVDIVSEYRCFILDDNIEAIQFYDGDFTVMLNQEDISLLREMVAMYSLDKNRPNAYTLDVAIIKDRGLSILEVHPHVSVGLYGYSKSHLLYSYAYGFDWYVSKNIELEESDSF